MRFASLLVTYQLKHVMTLRTNPGTYNGGKGTARRGRNSEKTIDRET